MEPVAYLDEDYAYVVVHRQQQLLEVFGLRRRVFAEDAAADLGQSVDYLGYLLAKEVPYVLCGVVGVFHYIMQQGGADAHRAQSYLLGCDARHGYGVHDIWLARQSLHAAVGLPGKVECLGDDVYLLAMARSKVYLEQFVEGFVYFCFPVYALGRRLNGICRVGS